MGWLAYLSYDYKYDEAIILLFIGFPIIFLLIWFRPEVRYDIL